MIRRSARLLVALGLLVGSGVAAQSVVVEAAASDSCNDGETANNLTLTPSHGEVFYIDSGQGQSADAAYVGYKVAASAAVEDIWVKVGTFAGGSVSLSDASDNIRPIGDIANGSASTVFFFLKAGAPTTTDQTHVVQVYDGKPTLAGATELLSCTFAFTEVRETIKAAANKVVDISAVSASTKIGGTYVIQVEGQTGKIGAGTSPDGSLIWLSPAARSDWPTKALRLESTSVALYGNKNCSGTATTYSNILLLDMTGDTSQKCYLATYTFRVVGQAATSVTAFPIAQIASGTQTKHTDLSTSEYTSSALTVDVSSTSVDLAVTHTVSGTTTVGASTTTIDYTVTLTNSGSEVTVDEVVVSPDADHTFESGTAQFDSASIADPSSEGGSTDLTFAGPFTIGASSTKTLTYSVTRACGSSTSSGTAYTDNQTALARVGSLRIGATAATVAGAQIDGTCGTASATATTTSTSLPVEAVTNPATSVTTSSATIHGVVNPKGRTNSPVRFFYSTDSSLSSYSVETSTAVSGNSAAARSVALSGLSAGTTYYYKVRIGGAGTLSASSVGDGRRGSKLESPVSAMADDTADGEVLSFTTTETTGTPTATTGSATSVDASALTATLNGDVDANSTSTKVLFEWAVDSSSGSCTSLGSTSSGYSWSDADDDSTYDSGEEDVLAGAYSTAVSLDITGLSGSTYYCFRVVALHDGSYSTRVEGSWVAFSTVTGVAGAPTSVSLVAGDTQLTVSWTAPADSGSSAITSYTASTSSGSTCSTSSTSCVITGLTNGTSYSVSVTATNTQGTGPASSSVSGTPVTVPGAPTSVSLVAGNTQLTVSWTAPASNGGSAITSYTASTSSGSTCTTSSTSCVITGLTNGTSYSVSVTATNAVGTGSASSAASGTPVATTTTTVAASTPAATTSTLAPSTSTTVTVAPVSTDSRLPAGKTPKESVSAKLTPSGGGSGELEIAPDENGPGIELESAELEGSSGTLEVVYSGSDYNKPDTWVAEGFGDVCWKIEPFSDADYVYTLPARPAPPSGFVEGMVYSAVKVKAGSIQSDDPNYQVNTVFMAPAGGQGVFADTNRSGTSDPGGRNGDKSISHVIVCVTLGTPSSPSAPTPTSPPSTTTAPTTTTTSTTTTTTTTTSTTTTTTTVPTGTTVPATTTPATTTTSTTSTTTTTSVPATSSTVVAQPSTTLATPSTTVVVPKPKILIRIVPPPSPTTTLVTSTVPASSSTSLPASSSTVPAASSTSTSTTAPATSTTSSTTSTTTSLPTSTSTTTAPSATTSTTTVPGSTSTSTPSSPTSTTPGSTATTVPAGQTSTTAPTSPSTSSPAVAPPSVSPTTTQSPTPKIVTVKLKISTGSETFPVEIRVDETRMRITSADVPLVGLPVTGGASGSLLPFALLVIALGCMVVTVTGGRSRPKWRH